MAATLKFTADLGTPCKITPLNGVLFEGDVKSTILSIRVMDNGHGADLSRCTPRLKIVQGRSQQNVTGSVDGDVVTFTAPSTPYQPGHVDMFVSLTNSWDASVTTILALSGMVEKTNA